MADTIRVRMYHVGFGDCFLITFPGQRHLLLDCGVHFRDESGDLAPVVELVGQHTGGELAVVVATHLHGDHLSGFQTERDAFRGMQAEEVWLPFCMDPEHPAARARAAKVRRLVRALGALDPARAAELERLELSNKAALEVLTGRWRERSPLVRWLPGEHALRSCPALPGVDIEVLGPRPDNPWLRQGDPRGEQQDDAYLADLEARLEPAAGGQGAPRAPLESPFGDRWDLEPAEARRLYPGLQPWPPLRAEDYLEEYLRADGAATNNTSLCLLLRCGGRGLLLPGDTQYGGWRAIYRDTGLQGRLGEVDLLKVSHHGSHNGTPPSLLEPMGRLVSLVSTRHAAALFPPIPHPPLLDALAEHGPVVRSDRPPVKAQRAGPARVVPEKVAKGKKPRFTDVLLGLE
ncbi:MAG TPA: hypothetical protein PK668_12835 [Myxococcota bacterium]|nr:hypothetical protein [Myxococcota bacterium]HRY93644.1 hypothetical protein [Myxococcota bacterium]HSA22253.1 hypothetical protein [Myxococcota bacterium]